MTLVACATTAGSVERDAQAPAPVPKGAYTLDKAHTSLIFRVSHLGFSTYTGRFTGVDATLQFDPANLAASRVQVRIDPRSIQADNAPSGFLQSLAGKEWLDADRFPEMTFRSQRVVATGVDTFRMKIWDRLTGQIIYDSQAGDLDDVAPATALGGGSIMIHKGK